MKVYICKKCKSQIEFLELTRNHGKCPSCHSEISILGCTTFDTVTGELVNTEDNIYRKNFRSLVFNEKNVAALKNNKSAEIPLWLKVIAWAFPVIVWGIIFAYSHFGHHYGLEEFWLYGGTTLVILLYILKPVVKFLNTISGYDSRSRWGIDYDE